MSNAITILAVMALLLTSTTSSDTELQALLNFKSSLTNNSALLDWTPSTPPCKGMISNWTGVMCLNGLVFGLRLENMGLSGLIDANQLKQLRGLRSISLMNNSFVGPLPSEINAIASLRSLHLSYNAFEGEIGDDWFKGMNLRKVYLARNKFSGRIPKSVVRLPKLMKLSLEGNGLVGDIPEFKQKDLLMVDVSNNMLEGPIPPSLSNMNSSFFTGNKGLCGKPLSPCTPPLSPPPPLHKRRPFLILIPILILTVIVSVLATCVCLLRRRPTKEDDRLKLPQDTKVYKKLASGHKEIQRAPPSHRSKKNDQWKLHFVRDDRERFTLQDMLKASAEVLGSGGFGSSYKAVLSSGDAVVVVKRFRYMNSVSKDDFYEHVRRIGRLSHPNLLPLVAFYYRKDEKLLVSDYVVNGSLANLLHATRDAGYPGLDWSTRLKIIKGVASGLAYLSKEFPDQTLPHGHLKSSNVLLNNNFEPLLSDYALLPLLDKEHAQQLMVGYKSPEFTQTTRKTDVWSLGILILELLTGKFPTNYLRQGKEANADLAQWVESVGKEEWTVEVFDKEMKAKKENEGEMLKLLKIGMCCCEWDVERRWELKEAVKKIIRLKETDNDDEDSSSAYATASASVSVGDSSFTRVITEELYLFG